MVSILLPAFTALEHHRRYPHQALNHRAIMEVEIPAQSRPHTVKSAGNNCSVRISTALMKHEPTIDRPRLLQAVHDAYGITVHTAEFVPVGYAAACYVLGIRKQAQYFLKLWPNTHAGRAAAARRRVYLPLVRALFERGLFTRVPYPLRARNGSLCSVFDECPYAVMSLVPGSTPSGWPDWPDSLWDELGCTMARIHRATDSVADLLPPRESFAIPFEADLRRGLERIGSVDVRARPGLRALRDLVLPRRDNVLAQLERLHGFRESVRALPSTFVLCHTDLGGDNVLVDDAGHMAVLDWDEVTLAPPEHDLQSAAGPHMGRLLRAYRAGGGSAPLYVEQFAFCLLRRCLHDMAVRLLRILDEHTTWVEDEAALRGIQLWGFDQWDALDVTLEQIAGALDENGH